MNTVLSKAHFCLKAALVNALASIDVTKLKSSVDKNMFDFVSIHPSKSHSLAVLARQIHQANKGSRRRFIEYTMMFIYLNHKKTLWKNKYKSIIYY